MYRKDPGYENDDEKTGKIVSMNRGANGYRLPTEAEWEYAARGGKISKGFAYSGNSSIEEVAWYRNNSKTKAGAPQTRCGGMKIPNELSIFDMSGNVWEWCWDWYSEDYYAESPEKNPAGAASGKFRVVRGGSWFSADEFCRVAFRSGLCPELGYPDWIDSVGFRLARNAQP